MLVDQQRPSQQQQQQQQEGSSSLETVAKLSELLSAKTEAAINQIDHINGEAQVLAINALIEASRAGEAGKAFTVVAEEMSRLSRKIVDTTDRLRKESRGAISELKDIIRMQATNIRGIRLSDLALTNIDLVDRNLYERSCDVRWWAKDSSMVAALVDKTPEALEMASRRLGVILDAYTVYFDLVLCDVEGTWWQTAARTSSGRRARTSARARGSSRRWPARRATSSDSRRCTGRRLQTTSWQ